MPTKLSTIIKKIESVPNPDNARLIFEFHKFMKSNGSSNWYVIPIETTHECI